MEFLLTHPVWDVTIRVRNPETGRNISTHTSRVGCDAGNKVTPRADLISTHTSRVGCDVADTVSNDGDFNFYSHIPCGM